MLTVLGLFLPNLWSLQYQSTHISIHHFARGQRLHVWRDGAFAAWCPLCGQEGAGVKVCSSWWRCCGGSSVDLPWELRYQHGETILWKTGFFFEHAAIGYLELIWHEHSVGCTPVSPVLKYCSTRFLRVPESSWLLLSLLDLSWSSPRRWLWTQHRTPPIWWPSFGPSTMKLRLILNARISSGESCLTAPVMKL